MDKKTIKKFPGFVNCVGLTPILRLKTAAGSNCETAGKTSSVSDSEAIVSSTHLVNCVGLTPCWLLLVGVLFLKLFKFCCHCRVAARQFLDCHILCFVVGKAEIAVCTQQCFLRLLQVVDRLVDFFNRCLETL